MRIVSLLPAATEWVAAIGAMEDLVGRSHACDFPPAVRSLPAVTRSRVAEGGDTRAINDAVRSTLAAGLSLYEVDLDALRALRPDVVLTQAQCAVCAVDLAGLEALLAGWTGTRPRLFSMAPMTFRAVLQEAMHLARLVDRLPQAMAVLGEGERRLRHLRDRLGLPRTADPATLPTVACIEWMEPLMTAGHWMPALVDHAGGRAVLAGAGKPSPVVDWEALRAADPDVIAIMPCGFSLEQTRRDLPLLTGRPGWGDLRAVRTGRVVLFDGNAYFNRPGPRLYRAAELLAAALYPERIPPDVLGVAPWEMASLAPLAA
ncbi:MAG: ABC transporter substrate-binding protein [Rhodothermaceae bacterium]|nr:MAG: ABC transporter substrate-binding protein [Rhodothermaceae bacterium]